MTLHQQQFDADFKACLRDVPPHHHAFASLVSMHFAELCRVNGVSYDDSIRIAETMVLSMKLVKEHLAKVNAVVESN